ncbi:MAG: EF-hand domain-containing protein, partial [archaeon]|nr:EF-hand domain-containing protein [archaeon]
MDSTKKSKPSDSRRKITRDNTSKKEKQPSTPTPVKKSQTEKRYSRTGLTKKEAKEEVEKELSFDSEKDKKTKDNGTENGTENGSETKIYVDESDPNKKQEYICPFSEEKLKELKESFDYFDKDQDGQLSIDEIYKGLKNMGNPMTKSTIREMIKELDTSEDEFLSFPEYCQFVAKRELAQENEEAKKKKEEEEEFKIEKKEEEEDPMDEVYDAKRAALNVNLENLAEALEVSLEDFKNHKEFHSEETKNFTYKGQEIEYFIVKPDEGMEGEVEIKYVNNDTLETATVFEFMDVEILQESEESRKKRIQLEIENLAKSLGVKDFSIKTLFRTILKDTEYSYDDKLIDYLRVNPEDGNIKTKFKGEREIKNINVHSFLPKFKVTLYKLKEEIEENLKNLASSLKVKDFKEKNTFYSTDRICYKYKDQELEYLEVNENGNINIKYKTGKTQTVKIADFIPYFTMVEYKVEEKVTTTKLRKMAPNTTTPESKVKLNFTSAKKRSFTPEELRILSKLFNEIDKDNSGEIEPPEIQEAMKNMGNDMPLEEIEEKMKEVDTNHTGSLSFRQFCNLLARVDNLHIEEKKEEPVKPTTTKLRSAKPKKPERVLTEKEKKIKEAFDNYNKDGKVKKEELQEMCDNLEYELSEEELDEILSNLKTPSNKSWNLEELFDLFPKIDEQYEDIKERRKALEELQNQEEEEKNNEEEENEEKSKE